MDQDHGVVHRLPTRAAWQGRGLARRPTRGGDRWLNGDAATTPRRSGMGNGKEGINGERRRRAAHREGGDEESARSSRGGGGAPVTNCDGGGTAEGQWGAVEMMVVEALRGNGYGGGGVLPESSKRW